MTLTATPRTNAGRLAVEIYAEVLDAVRADRLVRNFVAVDGDRLTIQHRAYSLADYRRVIVAGAGKASVEMASAVKDLLGERISEGLIVTKDGYGTPMPPFEVLEAGHPTPNAASLEAGRRMLALAESCKEDDLVIFLLSGGASALMELPVDEVTLEDLQATNQVLLASGADITLMNEIRSHISRLKAGGLARAFGHATVVCLVLSDVIGNSLATIGSGPLMAAKWRGEIPAKLIDSLPDAVRREVLSGNLFPRPTPEVPHFVIGSVSVAVHAAADAAGKRGLLPLAYGDPMVGEARLMARKILSLATRQIQAQADEPFCMIFGGETTVTLRGKGVGGRAQEMALAAVPRISKLSGAAFLAAGTDGTDGPTDAAGGLAEADSELIADAKGFQARRSLVANDSYPYLEACGGLIKTGPTGSNVNDLCLVVQAT